MVGQMRIDLRPLSMTKFGLGRQTSGAVNFDRKNAGISRWLLLPTTTQQTSQPAR
jgi:hypothetical protein